MTNETALDVLQELVSDVDAVYSWVNREWPDVMVTYEKAKAILAESKFQEKFNLESAKLAAEREDYRLSNPDRIDQ